MADTPLPLDSVSNSVGLKPYTERLKETKVRNVGKTKTENVQIPPLLCVSELTASQCQHMTHPKHSKQNAADPIFLLALTE